MKVLINYIKKIFCKPKEGNGGDAFSFGKDSIAIKGEDGKDGKNGNKGGKGGSATCIGNNGIAIGGKGGDAN